METQPSAAIPQADVNLDDLRRQSLAIVSRAIGIVAYTWFLFVVWPITGQGADAWLWLASAILVVGVSLSILLTRRHGRIATVVLIASTTISVSSLVVSSGSPHMAYLYVVPVILSSVLCDPRITGVVGIASIAILATVTIGSYDHPPLSPQVLLPVLVTALTTLSSWLSSRSLYTALEWTWNGYERARQQEEAGRQRGSELRQALKSLDEATYRLERINHMLVLAREQADEARHLKQQFAQTISHELRTPLNLIVGFSELMARSPEYYGAPLPPAYVRDLSIVHRNARHLQSLVSDVLDLARIEVAQMSLVLEETAPAAIVRDAIGTARSLVESRGLTLTAEIAPNLPSLRVDPTRIRQVLFNLLNNAARFTEQGGVSVSVRREENEVLFSVADTGIGIPKEDLSRIFVEFEQLNRAWDRRNANNVGLGLAISRGFVELHGGRIWVESEVGRGSTFSFALPIPDLEGAITALPQAPRPRGASATRRSDERLVLAVTHSMSAAGLLTRHLRGVRTVVAQDLDSVESLLDSLLPQAVIIDSASVPIEDDGLVALSARWGLPAMSVIACPLPGEEPLRRHWGVDAYLVKPVTREALWDLLRQFGQGVDKVLVVDDDADFVRLLGRILDSPVRRYSVNSASTGQEALEVLRRWRPDLVFLDLSLPDMDGLQILELMRGDPQWSTIPVAIVSGQDDVGMQHNLQGAMTIAKARGLTTEEVVRWLQHVVDAGNGVADAEDRSGLVERA